MTQYKKPTSVRIQVVIDQERAEQLSKLAEYTGASISRIVRLILDENSDRLETEISRARRESAQKDWTK